MTYTVQPTDNSIDDRETSAINRLLTSFDHADVEQQIDIFDALYRHYRPGLSRYASRTNAVDPDGAADLALFDGYRVLTKRGGMNDHTFRSYLFKAVRSHAVDGRRKAVPAPTVIDDDDIVPFVGFENTLIESLTMLELVDQLPEDQRDVITHRFIYGFTARETGLLLDKKPNAIYQLQHRATRRIHRMLLAGAVLVMVAAAAFVLTRLSDSQQIDSSPAERTNVVEQEPAPQPDPSVDKQPFPSPTTTAAVGQTSETAEIGQGIEAGANGDAESDVSAPQTAVATAPGEDAAPQGVVPPEEPVATPPTTVAVPDPQPEATIPPTTLVDPTPVLANDDTVNAQVGVPVAFDAVLNDGPNLLVESVTLMSGRVPGLTLGADGQLTGTPTQAASEVIVYRLNGSNGSSDLGMIRVTVTE